MPDSYLTPALSVNRDVNTNNSIVDNITGFVDLKFNDVSITLKLFGNAWIPQYLQSFEFSRMTNSLGWFTMTLVDNEWTTVESLLLSSANEGVNPKLRYGTLGVNGNINCSSFMDIRIVQYSLQPHLNYCIVNIEGVCLGLSTLGSSLIGSNAKVKNFLQNTLSSRESRKISDYVTSLADTLGFDKDHRQIEPTEAIFTVGDLGTSEQIEHILTCDNSTILTFITSQLVAKASSPDKKKSPYVFFVAKPSDAGSNDEKQKEVFHFHPISRNLNKDPRVVLTLYSDKQSQIKSFKPSFEHTLANIKGGTDVVAYGYDNITGQMLGIAYKNETNPSKQVSTSPASETRTAGHTPGNRASLEAAQKVVNAQITAAPLTAELTMVGDISYELCTCIDLYVNIPIGPNKGKPHNTSNRYVILGITDTISDGVFETKLDLATGFGFTPAGQPGFVPNQNTTDETSTSAVEKNIKKTEK